MGASSTATNLATVRAVGALAVPAEAAARGVPCARRAGLPVALHDSVAPDPVRARVVLAKVDNAPAIVPGSRAPTAAVAGHPARDVVPADPADPAAVAADVNADVK